MIDVNQYDILFAVQIKSQATGGFQAFIIHYREDPDQQNLIDWIQEDWASWLYQNYSTTLI